MLDKKKRHAEDEGGGRGGGGKVGEADSSSGRATAADKLPRNSSGSQSPAAIILDLRVKLNFAYEMLERCFEALGDNEALIAIRRQRQRGFRVDRRPR